MSRRVPRVLAPLAVAAVLPAASSQLPSCASPPSLRPLPALAPFVEAVPLAAPSPASVETPVVAAQFEGPVAQALEEGCSTTIVQRLSEQIIAESNCMEPGAYARVPDLAQMTLDDSVFPYLRRPARDSLLEALGDAQSRPIKINSMLRTVAQQYLLYDWHRRGRCGIALAAAPGRSNHQSGWAVDVSEPELWRRPLQEHGFRWHGTRDPWHFDYGGRRPARAEHLDVEAFQRLWNRNNPDEPIGTDGDWGPATERALRRAPAQGFGVGAVCAEGSPKGAASTAGG